MRLSGRGRKRPASERVWSNPLLLLVTATVFMTLLTAAEGAVYRHARGEPIAWASLLGLRLLDWSSCALLVPPLYLLARRLPHDRRFWTLTAPVLLLATLAAAVLKYVVHTPLAGWANPAGAREIAEALRADFLGKVIFYWGVLGLVYAVALARGDVLIPSGSGASGAAPPSLPGRLLAPYSRGTNLIPVDQIDWIEAQGNYCRIHAGGARQLVRKTLSSLLEELAPRGFLQVHRSKIVNTERVQRVESGAGQIRLVLLDGSVVTGGRAYAADVRRLVGGSSRRS